MIDRDRLDFFFLSLDANLQVGTAPDQAIIITTEQYARVFYPESAKEQIVEAVSHKKPFFQPFFRWYDLWIGGYIDIKNQAIYICPLPMVGIKINYGSHRAAA
jgi:hypothetical protein